MKVVSDFIRLRNKTTDAKETGLTVALLPDGGTAPGDLIALTENGGINWQYDFPSEVTNGIYTVYVGGAVMKINGVDVQIRAIRGGIVSAGDTDFAQEW